MRKRKVGYVADGIPFSLACLITSSNIKINHLNYFFIFLYAFMNPDTVTLLPIAYYTLKLQANNY
jgi:hypothetical protein